MKDILAYIDQKKQEFAKLPFFEYLRDSSISPEQRLSFAPCTAPFVMSFGELNKSVLRSEPTDDLIQQIINKHTYEDDHHWIWFLEDLEKLNLNLVKPFNDTLKFLWGEETISSRRLAYELYHCTINATSIQKLIIMEVIEATGNVLCTVSSEVVRELQFTEKKKNYRYFGANHLMVEQGHVYTLPKIGQVIENIEISEEEKKSGLKIIDHIFLVFSEFVDGLFKYLKSRNFNANIQDEFLYGSSLTYKPIGGYLIDAGLLKTEQLEKALLCQESMNIPIGKIISSQGWVKQETIEYLCKKIISSERQSNSSSKAKYSRPEKLGKYLVDAELINFEQLQSALDEQHQNPSPIGQILSRNGLVNQQTIEYFMEKLVLPDREINVLNSSNLKTHSLNK